MQMQIDEYVKLFSQLIRLKKSKLPCETRKLNGPEKFQEGCHHHSQRCWTVIFATLSPPSSNKLNQDHLFKRLRGSPIIHQLPTNLFFPGAILSPLSCWGGIRALDSGMMVPVQVGNNEDDWCDIIGRTGPTLTTPSERSPPLSWTLTLLLFHRALPDYQRSSPPQ